MSSTWALFERYLVAVTVFVDDVVSAVAGPQHPLAHQLLARYLQVVGEPQARAQVQETCGPVAAVLSELSRLVVPGEHVVVVVPALSQR